MSVKDYVPFSIAHAYFYDVPERLPDGDSLFAASERSAPEGWTRQANGLSLAFRPNLVSLPEQGWKIHISTTPHDANRVIELVWKYCIDSRIAFKFLRSRSAVLATNSKYWSRSASGKFITLYPVDNAQFTSALLDLEPALRDSAGPYILSDLRFSEGPLFVRYGAFKLLWHINEDGTRIPAIRAPDQSLVPDNRGPVFTVPDFVTAPRIIEPYLHTRPGSLENFQYEFEQALHFSNAGGIYLARSSVSGASVLMREARPHAGLDGRGNDAVARLQNEHDILSQLQGLDSAPRLIERCRLWEHHFLVTEYIDGPTLLQEIVRRYPLVHPDPAEADLTEYVRWAGELFTRLEGALEHIHARGVRIADLHPSNIMIRPNGDVVIVDFECGSQIADISPPALGAPGFAPPTGLSVEEADRYAFDCVRLMVLLPLVPLLNLDRSKATTLVSAACANLPVDATLARSLESGLSVADKANATSDLAAAMFMGADKDWPSIRKSLAAGILATASPERSDRLFPGDPLQFTFGGATLGYGAAGILLALAQAGETVPPALAEWLSRAGSQEDSCSGAGFYDGLHGVAYVLELLGARDAALDVLNRAASGTALSSVGLFSGRSGIALNYLHFAQRTGDSAFLSAALRLGEDLARTILADDGAMPGTRPGLLHGASGPALLCLRLYEETGDTRYLNATELALRNDLSHGTMLSDGTFHLRSGARYLIYLDGGSIGIALVLARFLRHREVADLAALLQGIYRGCRIPFVMQPGLFQGRAGLIAALSESSYSEAGRAAVIEQVGRLGWHALLHNGQLAFPGTGLTRLSCDLATGSAGVMLALQSAFDGESLRLPFL